LLLLIEPPVGGNYAFRSAQGFFLLTWEEMGMRGRDDVVVVETSETREAPPPPAIVGYNEPTSTPAPPVEVPLVMANFMTESLNGTHPITAGIEDALYFSEARSFEVDQTPGNYQVAALVFSPPDYFGETRYNWYLENGYAAYDADTDSPRTGLPLAAALENNDTKTRLVVIGDLDFALNGGGLQTSPPFSPNFLYPGNVRFLMNAVAWLVDAEPVELTFSEPGPTGTPTNTLSPTATLTPTLEGEGEAE
jgi:hypothetical protein